jgi:hypothetical protein
VLYPDGRLAALAVPVYPGDSLWIVVERLTDAAASPVTILDFDLCPAA